MNGCLKTPDANPWRDHDGQKAPVHQKAYVTVRTRDGAEFDCAARNLQWSTQKAPGDIVRWRYA